MLFMVMTSQSGDRVTKFHITMDSAQEKINNALKVLKFVRSRQTWLRGITQDVEPWNEHCHSQPIPVQFLSTQLSIWKSGANFPHSGMPVQNELCGILIEDFLSIWKFRAVFLFGILVILFEGMMDLGVLELMGADSYLSGILPLIFQDVSSRWAIPSSSCLVFSQVGIT